MILKFLGRDLTVVKRTKRQHPNFVRMATITANVSFRDTLTEDELVQSLLKGKVAQNKRPHFRALLEEAPSPVVDGLVEQVGQWIHKPEKVKKNLVKIASELGSSKSLERWTRRA